MDYFVIEGGRRLEGEIKVFAAKNAILPMMAAAILADGEVVLRNVPDIADVRTMSEVLIRLGAEVEFDRRTRSLFINASRISFFEAPYDLVRRMRASFLVLGPLLAKYGKARVSQPGGCAIGARPVDQHIRGFQRLGARITDEEGYTIAEADRLRGTVVYFDRPSHTGTENIMMAAVLADGTTEIVNASQEPEVVDLANMLNAMGAKIYGAGTSRIVIEGVSSLGGIDYTPLGDRLEAGTYLFGVMSTGGKVKVTGVEPKNLCIALFKMSEMGAKITTGADFIELETDTFPKPVNIVTAPFPGFPTDLQPMAMAVLTRAAGVSVVWERIFENRFIHVMELIRLGAQISISGDKATIIGTRELKGAKIMASDIRGGAGLLIAGLSARGKTILRRVYHIDRGYERIEERFGSLGAHIKRLSY